MKIQQLMALLRKKSINLAVFIAEEQPNPIITQITQLPNFTQTILLVPTSGKPIIYVSGLSYGGIKKQPNLTVKKLDKPLSDIILSQKRCKTVGIDAKRLSHYRYEALSNKLKDCKLIDISEHLASLSPKKESWEIERIKQAAEIADRALSKIINNFSFSTEAEVCAALEYEITSAGASIAFPTIIASGKNAAVPHHITSDTKLKRGFCIIDFGACYKGYNSDCTRTIFIGTPSSEEISLYRKVLGAQKLAIKKAKHGASCSALDKIARKALGTHSKYFIHSLGHGIGTEVHEEPDIGKKSASKLSKNIVFTIEPGIYIPGKLGIRIEDTLVMRSKAEYLTSCPKEELISVNTKN